ncbi:MAG: pyridoxal-phosphate dependent enzyme [Ilumatobacter sp.]|uniref:threonine ammonia-lyase n=1 Tax=Ilumatobacter sp. TaxID=1967498 RepID=UPI002607B910|nr:pyridoxal-phosphate dependent enzyme [Ilumatobacter sp.]MDJ0769298.1 pyridoxal-phosphate dependent enzyme [Ilumatobacter sp.]
MDAPVDLDSIRAAREAGRDVVRRTPVLGSATLSSGNGPVVLKAENLQRTGSFKVRGAMNKLASLGDAAGRGVTAGSAGNHAQALAFAASQHGVRAEIFVPTGASVTKIAACEGYGASVTERGATLLDAVEASVAHAAATGSAFCHPFDDPVVVAGQGTLGLELVEDVDDLACVVVPLGGGGLAAGTAVAVKSQRPDVRVIGVQAAVCAPYAGHPPSDGPILTLADGIAVKRPGEVTAPLVERWLDEVVTVDEDAIADAMVMLLERAKLAVEGGGAVGVSALMSGLVTPPTVGTTCVVLSGGNVDLGAVPGLIRRHEHLAGRRLALFARIDDRPGGLARFLAAAAAAGADLIEVQHLRECLELHVRETGIRATFEVRGPEHADRIVAALCDAGYSPERR